ncbi:MAG: SAM-dependent methyltransferase [Flavobacteriales bacterium]
MLSYAEINEIADNLLLMNWKEYWNNKASAKSSLARVGREDNAALFELTLKHLDALVRPTKQMILLDLCCGNGLVSQFFGPKVNRLVGVDLSPVLLSEAKELNLNFSNSSFICADACAFSEKLNQQFDVVLLHFSFQYFETNAIASSVLAEIKKALNGDGKVVITDIPDARKLQVFYPGLLGRLRRIKQKTTKTSEMGRFWHPKTLQKIAVENGFAAEILEQDAKLPYSHYRFDVILKRKD